MNTRQISKILHDNDFVHESGTPEELKVAEYIMARCEEMGVKPHLEGFEVDMADVKYSKLTADGVDIPCEGFRLCGSGEVEAPFLYMPSTDPDSIAKAKGKIVLLDSGLTHFVFQDLYAAGVAGIITYTGNVFWRDNDIDHKELRGYVSLGKKKLAVNINAKSAAKLVRMNPKTVKISVTQDEFKGESHNVVAEIPGESDEFIVLSAHYDTTYLSHGSYDNLTGSIGLLGIMDELRNKKHHYGLRFVWCGSEERGLLGSKAYAAAHEEELKEKCVLNVNIDMIGSLMGKLMAIGSAEEAAASYLKYLAAEVGVVLDVRTGVGSTDSTSFADKGVPAVTFGRMAPQNQATIHVRYDTIKVLSMDNILADLKFIAEFTRRMADAARCPVSRKIPDSVKKQLDEYLNRVRKD
ncbi:MAG: M28 family peptidase [Eubacteriaceae bacterium]|nr:M28 family peptidase [Eubacteriaceae bacterium]MBR5996107.1 M28 family peptidase [Eubacteriaceae bacterium]